MTPREVVQRAVEFRGPARLAINGFDELSDCVWIGPELIKPKQADDDPNVDQWLCRWAKTDEPNMGQVKGHPLDDLAAMADFPWPDGDAPRRYEAVPTKLVEMQADPARRDKYVLTSIFMLLWERMHSLRGFENCMLDLMDDTPAIHELADRIVEYDLAVIRNMHRTCGDAIQGFNFTDDWGTQIDLHVSPELFERFFLPRYRRIFAAAHECGWHVWMHSCGKINKALGMLIDAGCDLLNMQQPLTNGIEEVGRSLAGKVCFETLCDIQKTLPAGDRAQIEAEAERLMDCWGTPDGGFILGDYGDHRAIGTLPETKQFMLETFRRLDPWRRRWGA